MGVYISVGWLDEMRRCDAEGFASAKKFFKQVAQALKKAKLPTYNEPADLKGETWGCKVFPSNGIAYLQRLAVYLWKKEDWPTPGTEDMDNPLTDPKIERAYENCYFEATEPNRKGQRFNHLVCHPCMNDYWLPVEFDEIVTVDGAQCGSSLRLKRETQEIAKMLELPLDMDPRSAATEKATRHASRRSRTLWKKYGIEAYSCLLLYHAAAASERLGAAIYLH
jgi:hypothetical protein